MGDTPLMVAVKDPHMSWDIVEILTLYGAKVTVRNKINFAPSDLAPELTQFQRFCMDELIQVRKVLFMLL